MKQSREARKHSSPLAGKVLAVGSGKGGVGKSTTSVNLAICFARQGLRTALCDLDPLSDIAVILDIRTPEEQLSLETGMETVGLDEVVLPVLPRLDLLFPASKLGKAAGSLLRNLMFQRYAGELNSRYDIIIIDLPAGIGREENLSFLPHTDNLVVVTNPEPTSHVSAGGYIRAALDIHPGIQIHLWHNRYRVDPAHTFNTRDVTANYNRFVDQDLRIKASEALLNDAAFVPEDPSLNLLKGGLPVTLPVLSRLRDALDGLNERIVMTAPMEGSLNRVTEKLLRYHLARTRSVNGNTAAEAVTYLEAFSSGEKPLDTPDREAVENFCRRLSDDEVRRSIISAMAIFDAAGEKLLEKERLFSPPLEGIRKGKPDTAAAAFLRSFVRSAYYRDRFMRYSAALVLYYYSLYRLLQTKSVSDLFLKLIPVRKEGGRLVRDRHRQIAFLLEKDERYHRRYFLFIKQLFPVALKQVDRIAATLGVRNLLLPNSTGTMNKNAYLRLLADVVQDTLNSGLGILSGQRFNDASREVEKGARNIRASMFNGD